VLKLREEEMVMWRGTRTLFFRGRESLLAQQGSWMYLGRKGGKLREHKTKANQIPFERERVKGVPMAKGRGAFHGKKRGVILGQENHVRR